MMELMAESLGISAGTSADYRLSLALLGELKNPHALDASDRTRHLGRLEFARSVQDRHNTELFMALFRAGNSGSSSPAAAKVRFLIATIPDYADSNSGWMADSVLSGIQHAMSRGGYSLDRFRLVDWSPTEARPNVAATESRAHERQPGALIFRRVQLSNNTGQDVHASITEFYVVLLAPETATAGIHAVALRNAVEFVGRWNRKSNDAGWLQIVGPTFSGSVPSLAQVVGSEGTKYFPASKIIVISGAANADANRSKFTSLARSAEIRYATTVPKTSDILATAQHFLSSKGFDSDRTALLIESNTAYGEDATSGRRENIFRFPLHVSQLRNDMPAAPATAVTFSLAPAVPLSLRESKPPSDQLPALRPILTSPTVAVTIKRIFDAVRHKGIHAVGIVATDVRDVLFLSRELKQTAPDVQLFILGSHALYLHPDFRPYLRGALVASPYPLHLAVQQPSNPAAEQIAFESMEAEGVFNAVTAQLAAAVSGFSTGPEAGRPTSVITADGGKLLDYKCMTGERDHAGIPAEPPPSFVGECAPMIWLSVVGADAFWPLEFARPSQPTIPAAAALLRARRDALPIAQESARVLGPLPASAILPAVVIVAVAALHFGGLLLVAKSLRRKQRSNSDFGAWRRHAISPRECGERRIGSVVSVLGPPITPLLGRQMHALALNLMVLFVSVLTVWTLAVILSYLQPPVAWAWALRSIVITGGVSCFALALYVSRLSIRANTPEIRRVDSRRLRFHAPRAAGSVALVPAIVVALAAAAFLVQWTYEVFLSPRPGDAAATLTAARTVSAGVVSPGIAVALLCSAMYVPMPWSLRRLSLVGIGYQNLGRQSATFSLLSHRVQRAQGRRETEADSELDELARTIDMPAQSLKWRHTAFVALLLAMLGLSLGWPLRTFEHPSFSRFFALATLSCFAAVVLLLSQAARTWQLLRLHLLQLAKREIAKSFDALDAAHVDWNLSLAPPHVGELRPLVELATGIREQVEGLTAMLRSPAMIHERRAELRLLRRLALRDYSGMLALELQRQPFAGLLESHTFQSLWRLSDALVTVSERTDSVHIDAFPPIQQPPHKPDVKDARFSGPSGLLVALLFAFVFRDVLARTVSALFAATLTLVLVTGAHLFYTFQGRTSYLLTDVVMIVGASAVTLWILVSIERDRVISSLRKTTPGKVEFNWNFIRQVAISGALPVLAILGALFPEVGESVFGWLEPLRRIVSF